MKNLEHLRLTR